MQIVFLGENGCNVNGARIRIPLQNVENGVNERRRELSILFRGRFRLVDGDLNENSRLCLNCNLRLGRCIENDNNPLAVSMEVLFRRRGCFICNDGDDNVAIQSLSIHARVDFYVKTKVFLPSAVTCCLMHLTDAGLIPLQHMENDISIPMKIVMTGEKLSEWFTTFRECVTHNSLNLYESEENFNENDFQSLTSLTKEQFRELFNYCQPVEVYHKLRRLRKKQLIAFLIKLRLGVSDGFIQSI